MANISCSRLTELPSRLEATAVGSSVKEGAATPAIRAESSAFTALTNSV